MSESTDTTIDDELRTNLFHQRVIVLGDQLDANLGNRLTSQLFLLAAQDPRKDISFWINSPGGSVPAMLSIADVIALIPNDVATVALGTAASAGQFLLSAGTPGKRYVLPHSRILMHQGSAGIGGTAVDVEVQAKDLRHTRDTVLGLIAGYTGQPLDRIVEDSQHDHWYTAEEAVDYGFADRIVDRIEDAYPSFHRPASMMTAAAIGGAR
ncbi:ATP-dependent Clp protease proteolytic subunit [Gordonia araii NBRC 100433]|uniref:ATP-dependent Clp protease proteolytic subunit n=1 Tax=Gordonia araii NBRC 100433 TaxID=1073574 RepID=G7GYY8_9ACTN|nr:ATP-dependent Clp protease proteolytic subunit [Gordonia araii]NNG97023.1 ATP-dependent Clp protease proteolytic subunit [Gordonia araii NBRC 100433]GAB08813.1 ATP-dependent Clp protease proteolytic subunit [Gordonia araii NBRC 100433]